MLLSIGCQLRRHHCGHRMSDDARGVLGVYIGDRSARLDAQANRYPCNANSDSANNKTSQIEQLPKPYFRSHMNGARSTLSVVLKSCRITSALMNAVRSWRVRNQRLARCARTFRSRVVSYTKYLLCGLILPEHKATCLNALSWWAKIPRGFERGMNNTPCVSIALLGIKHLENESIVRVHPR